jgi:hypothetical protein
VQCNEHNIWRGINNSRRQITRIGGINADGCAAQPPNGRCCALACPQ